jgi:hypothetical protein
LQKEKHASHQTDTESLQGGNREFAPADFLPIGIDSIPHDQRHGEIKDNVGQNAGNPDKQRHLVRPKITQQLAQVIHR